MGAGAGCLAQCPGHPAAGHVLPVLGALAAWLGRFRGGKPVAGPLSLTLRRAVLALCLSPSVRMGAGEDGPGSHEGLAGSGLGTERPVPCAPSDRDVGRCLTRCPRQVPVGVSQVCSLSHVGSLLDHGFLRAHRVPLHVGRGRGGETLRLDPGDFLMPAGPSS